MSANTTSRTILIRDNTLLPAGLAVESEVFLPGWRVVKNLDGYGLGQKIEKAKWYFFYLAGDVKATVRKGTETLRKAVRTVLAKPEAQKFNSLEITKTATSWFLGVPFLSITAHFRHIQPSLLLEPANDFTRETPAGTEGVVMATNKYGTLAANS